MEKVWKLTTADGLTRPGQSNETKWGENITHTAPGKGELCTAGWIHAYASPLLAVLMNSVHANYKPAILWECEAEVGIRKADKIGCSKLTTLRQVNMPEITTAQKQAFAILCAKQVYKDSSWLKWADDWLSGKDRSARAADVAYTATRAADVADVADVAYAAAYTALAARAADVADVAYVAYAVAYAADAAGSIDLVAIAEQAVRDF